MHFITFFYLKSVYYGSNCVKSEFQYALSKQKYVNA